MRCNVKNRGERNESKSNLKRQSYKCTVNNPKIRSNKNSIILITRIKSKKKGKKKFFIEREIRVKRNRFLFYAISSFCSFLFATAFVLAMNTCKFLCSKMQTYQLSRFRTYVLLFSSFFIIIRFKRLFQN